MRKFVCGMFLFATVSYAQDKKTQEKAEKLYQRYAYVDAIKVYERLAEKGEVNQEILQNLANSYYFNADYKNANKWYSQLFEFIKNQQKAKIGPEYYYRYAQTLKAEEKYTEANEMLDVFAKLVGETDRRASLYEQNKDYLQEIKDNSNRFKLNSVSINSDYSEYGTAFYGRGKAVITASRKPTSRKNTSKWTGESYFDLYLVDRNDENLQEEKLFSSVLNTNLNESTPVFTKDLKTVYFTRNNYTNGREGMDSDNTILLKLYKSTKKENGEWTEAQELPFNSNNYSTAHPALSPDEKYLYFVSDMKGTVGKSDIFRVTINSDGTYGKPENLGTRINTEGRETFPFISDENVLYFSSDGLPGLGGLDIFGVKINADGSLGILQNIGRPGNSPYDDFAFVVDSSTNEGFLTSNRPGAKAKDNIYGFTERPPLVFDNTARIQGVARDIETGAPLANTKVTLVDKRQNEVKVVYTDEQGNYDFGIQDFALRDDYAYIRAEKPLYGIAETQVKLHKGIVTSELLLRTVQKQLKVGDDLAKFFGIENIYFDLDKWNIRKDAAINLAKILDVLQSYPTMKIDIKTHTDSRASDTYNMKLSDRRAKSIMAWLVGRGISADRLKAQGMGETQLVNECSNGVKCTEEQHQKNRRGEFIITEL